jgi:hypothetical protein
LAVTEMTELPQTIRPAQAMTPNEMRALKEHTGRSLQELIGGDAEDMDLAPDRIQAMVWVALRRTGHPDVTWQQAGDVLPDFTEAMPDPTSNASANSSFTSVASGA